MADETEETETEETEVEETETEETDDEAGWNRLADLVRSTVKEELTSWSGPKNKQTTSSRSQQRPVKKVQRKQGFLSGQFFSNLNPTDDDRR